MNESPRWRGFDLQSNRTTNEISTTMSAGQQTQAMALARAQSASALDPPAFKFLRKALYLSQTDVANMLDLSKQTVSSWERGCVPLPRYADLILRALVREAIGGNAALGQVVNYVR